MDLHNLSPNPGSKKNRFVKGRGHASGNGKTAGRGQKGQKSRSGGRVRPGFEGGQMPLYRRLPKRGFTCRNSKKIDYVNLEKLDVFEDGEEVTLDTLIEKNILKKKGKKKRDGFKILAKGEITKKLTVKANAFSAAAKEKIEAAGGKAEVV